MTIVLENVNQQHVKILKELAKVLKFKINNVEDTNLNIAQRIENIELGKTNLVTPDWDNIMQQARRIK